LSALRKRSFNFEPLRRLRISNLGKCTALAGLDVIDLYRGPKTAVMLQYIAGANFVSVNFGHG